jgi:hypothetical protein
MPTNFGYKEEEEEEDMDYFDTSIKIKTSKSA